MKTNLLCCVVFGLTMCSAPMGLCQPPGDGGAGRPDRQFGGGPGFGGPPGGQDMEVLERFDNDKNGWLNREERGQAREFLNSEEGKKLRPRGPFGRGGRGPGPDGLQGREGGRGAERGPGRGFGFPGGQHPEPTPGEKVDVNQVKASDAPLYDPNTLRTIFLNFEETDWEKALEDFHDTDVDIPATMIVDGKVYEGVGIRFRGMSSYGMVPSGHKRSFNVSVDYINSKQDLYGHNTLNLLNNHEDDSILNAVLYSHIARQYIPALKANIVKVVINGESWGLYTNLQQFNKDFLKENYGSSKGARWKVRGSPMGNAGLAYMGDDVKAYEAKYTMKAGDQKDWKALVDLCRIIDQTPADKLETELRKVLDVDEVLWFLALDNALINCDGYWIRASDYVIHRDNQGIFHVLPGDMNEAFRQPMGPGMGGFGPRPGMARNGEGRPENSDRPRDGFGPPEGFGPPDAFGPPPEFGPPPGFGPPGAGDGPRGGIGQVEGVKLDPLVGMDDASKPLRSKLLAVPSLREKYLSNVQTIARDSLDWTKLGVVVDSYRKLIEAEVKADTKKLATYEAFEKATSSSEQEVAPEQNEQQSPRGFPFGRNKMSLKKFADDRRAYLLTYEDTSAK